MINCILYQPEKPANTGNIMRTCSAIGARLHIIGPLTYPIDEHSLKRAGMDYISNLDYIVYKDLDEFFNENKDIKIYYITRYGKITYSSIDYKKDYKDLYFMFGKESTGIPKELLASHQENCLRIPMKVDARSLNLSNCVALVLFEALRQLDFLDLATQDYLKGNDYLEQFNK